jgi:hypothetical protein
MRCRREWRRPLFLRSVGGSGTVSISKPCGVVARHGRHGGAKAA